MTRYRVVAPGISPAALLATLKCQSVPTYYRDDEVVGGDQADIDRLIADGFLEAIPEPESAST